MSILGNIDDTIANMDHYVYLHYVFVDHVVNIRYNIRYEQQGLFGDVPENFTLSDPLPNSIFKDVPDGFIDWMIEHNYIMCSSFADGILLFKWKFKDLVAERCRQRKIQQ